MGSRATSVAAAVALVAGVVLVVVLSSGSPPPPFDADSAAPSGYRALSLLLQQQGVESRTLGASEVAAADLGPGDALVVPVAAWSSAGELEDFRSAAERGATVVLAAEEDFYAIEDRQLVRTPAQPVPRGVCTIAELEDLEAVDDIGFALLRTDRSAAAVSTCFADGLGALVTVEEVTADQTAGGSLVHLASPYLWANARLQPDKEAGGEPLDNGPMAVALLEGADRVTFVEAEPPAGTSPDGTRSPLELLPFTVKVALVQCGFAFVIFAWWRGRRLGAPVREQMPVEVAGSELVEAVGGLLRRHGSVGRAATVLRERECRELAARLGVPREAGPEALAAAVAARSGLEPAQVHAVLFGPPPDGPNGLIALTHQLDSLHSEVLDVEPAP